MSGMYKAFLERGHEVKMLCGNCGRGRGKFRSKDVKKIIEWLNQTKPDICYIESSTYPIIHSCDYRLLRDIKRKRIPTAYFYRDFFRKFPELYPRRRGFVNYFKEMFLNIMQKRTDSAIRKLDIIYFPSSECFSYFHYKNMKDLPPAGEIHHVPRHNDNNRVAIYVGGVSESYGIALLLEAFRILNRKDVLYQLILVCRAKELEKYQKLFCDEEWLKIYHAKGEELEELYQRAEIGLLALRSNEYNNLAVGTKLFQYVSYGLPVVSTNVSAMKRLIEKNYFGIVAPDNPADYAAAIKETA